VKSVCILTSGYLRDNARNFQRQAKSILSFGFNVSILTNDGGNDECIDGIDIYCTKFWKSRIMILLFAWKQFYHKSININADIYLIHSPELLLLGLLLKLKGKKVIYDAHEDLPNHIIEKEWLPRLTRKTISYFTSIYMNFVFSKIDAVISPHTHVLDRYSSINKNCILIANFPLYLSNLKVSYSEYCKRGKVICYSGTCYPHSNQLQILEAIKDFEFLSYSIAGFIPEDLYFKMQEHVSFSKVNFLGMIKYKSLKDFYKKAQIGLVIMDYKLNLGGKRGTFAVNKIFEYMEAGLPIICSDYDLWIELIDKYKCGLYVKPGDIIEIKKAIKYLYENPKIAYKMGQNGINAIDKEYNWKVEENKLRELFLNKLC